jgi:hypothetical protein
VPSQFAPTRPALVIHAWQLRTTSHFWSPGYLRLEEIAANGSVCTSDGEQNVEPGPFDPIVMAEGYQSRDGLAIREALDVRIGSRPARSRGQSDA